MKWRNIKLVFMREVRDQLRDKRTLFMIAVLPMMLYPALGIGMVQMTVLFTEQPRTVVMLGEEYLPDEPKLMDENGFQPIWFSLGESDARKLNVVSKLRLPNAGDSEHEKQRREQLKMLAQTADIRDRLFEIKNLESAGTTASIEKIEQLRTEVADLLAASTIQVVVVIPRGFADSLKKMDELLLQRDDEQLKNFDYERPMIVRNSADEKSLVAFERVKEAFRNWESSILADRLTRASLPSSLHTPVKVSQVDLAVGEQLAANVWSKVFPAMLVIMAVTGAFYPAIDLGAGEKERGTMETLLICPATRAEIVMGKFFTVMLFSVSTALLNLGSMGLTGQYMVSLIDGSGNSRLSDMAFPPLASLAWLVVLLIPLAALFSAICLALALFARSSKEGQHYLTPLLMVTMGLTVFCLSPAVEITPFYSIVPIVNVALLLKGLLLAPLNAAPLYVYMIPVLLSSIGYSLLALWWAIEMFANERVLFRESERFELRLWFKQLMRQKGPTPSFAEGGFCFMVIMFLQFGAMRFMRPDLSAGNLATSMMKLLVTQQFAIIAAPALIMAFVLTTRPFKTLRIRIPNWKIMATALVLPFVLHPLTVELQASMNQWFFPALPESITNVMAMMGDKDIPLWIVLSVFALAPAICEELAFRGFILSGFERSRQKRVAIALSALVFGIMHMIPQQVFNAALLGLVLGLIAVRGRSLLPCIAFHFIYNSLAVLHGRFGTTITTDNIFGHLFRHQDGALRYQPLLLLMAAIVASALLRGLISFRPGDEIRSEHVTEMASTKLTAV
jgi:sodium transport system permease protein